MVQEVDKKDLHARFFKEFFTVLLPTTGSPLFPRMFGGKENPREVKSAPTETWVPEVPKNPLNGFQGSQRTL